MNCIHCGSGNTQKRGFLSFGSQRRYCKDCKKWFSGDGAPKILLLDIETSHIEFRGWDVGQQYVRKDQVTKGWYIICWSAKWLFEPKVYSDSVSPSESKARNDKEVVTSLHKMMTEADIVITQNGDFFDIPKLNWKFMTYGLPPNNQYMSIDTYKKSKQIVAPISRGLDWVAGELGFGGKSETSEQDWILAEAGDQKSITKLSKYCDNDVYILEEWYLRLRPWMKTHPNLATYMQMYIDLPQHVKQCPRCLNPVDTKKLGKIWRNPASGKAYTSGFCIHCGSHIRVEESKKHGKRLKA